MLDLTPMARHNAALTLLMVRDNARDKGQLISRMTTYRNAQNIMARHSQEAMVANMVDDATALDSAAKYLGYKSHS